MVNRSSGTGWGGQIPALTVFYQPSGYMDVEEMAKVLKKHLPKYVSCDKIISVVSRRVGMADDADSKSVAGNRVRVQVPLPASIRVRVMAHETRKDPCRS